MLIWEGMTLCFSVGVPSNELLPLAKLNKEIVYAARKLKKFELKYAHIIYNCVLILEYQPIKV
jgi:hypothetical protein